MTSHDLGTDVADAGPHRIAVRMVVIVVVFMAGVVNTIVIVIGVNVAVSSSIMAVRFNVGVVSVLTLMLAMVVPVLI